MGGRCWLRDRDIPVVTAQGPCPITMSDTAPSRRRSGRPPRGTPPSFPRDEVDRLLVHGEVITTNDGEGTTIHYPSYREVAERYGVAHSLIAQFSKTNQGVRRREQAKARVAAKSDEKLIELRATAVALSKDDELRIIDSYIAGFERALAVGEVRFADPGDFNAMVRLKAFVQGGADSRAEVQTSISLEWLQSRHQGMLRAAREISPEERGEIGVLDVEAHEVVDETEQEMPENWPPISNDIK